MASRPPLGNFAAHERPRQPKSQRGEQRATHPDGLCPLALAGPFPRVLHPKGVLTAFPIVAGLATRRASRPCSAVSSCAVSASSPEAPPTAQRVPRFAAWFSCTTWSRWPKRGRCRGTSTRARGTPPWRAESSSWGTATTASGRAWTRTGSGSCPAIGLAMATGRPRLARRLELHCLDGQAAAPLQARVVERADSGQLPRLLGPPGVERSQGGPRTVSSIDRKSVV